MKLEILKDGKWYVTGKGVRILVKGEKIISPQDVPEPDAQSMIESGWAKEAKKPKQKVKKNKSDSKTLNEHIEEINSDNVE